MGASNAARGRQFFRKTDGLCYIFASSFLYICENKKKGLDVPDFSFIDLFAGIGGFHLALAQAGGRCIGFSEIYPDAISSYCENFHVPVGHNFGDITKIQQLPKVDFITAGVPCQSWSIAGKNLGFDDDRGQLWNDTLYILNSVRPKAFIFENVKGLADPRNEEALNYILARIKEAGYHAEKHILNAYDYGSPQTRVRIYIVGFRNKKYLKKFKIGEPTPGQIHLRDILDNAEEMVLPATPVSETRARWSLSCNDKGFNDYFLFNDIRNGDTTIHSWDIINTTERQKHICLLHLTNRRSRKYGQLDGNALGFDHFKKLDPTIKRAELNELVKLGIFKHYKYLFEIARRTDDLTTEESVVLSMSENNLLLFDKLKTDKVLKKQKINVKSVLTRLEKRGIIRCIETRYEFKYTKISTGIDGINRIFLPSSKIYPTLVASDTNDFITTISIDADTPEEWKAAFLREVFTPGNYRKITRSEACRIQGFPPDFILPNQRERWMHLIGNSVAVPVIRMLVNAVVNTGVFSE